MPTEGLIGKRKGGIKSGNQAVKKKTGIHGLSSEEKQKVAIKGKNAFLEKMKDPAYALEHSRKIKEGQARRKHFENKRKEAFGFF